MPLVGDCMRITEHFKLQSKGLTSQSCLQSDEGSGQHSHECISFESTIINSLWMKIYPLLMPIGSDECRSCILLPTACM